MAWNCASCGTANPDRFSFCGGCGVALAGDASASAATATIGPSPPIADGERRQLTVLFCDFAHSTELAHRLDPEEWREILRAWQETCAAVLSSGGGHLAHWSGDAVKAYFGYPRAQEDDASRALRAGLALVGAMPALSARFASLREPIRVHVGIHTGLVVTGDLAGEKGAAVGETPIAAARLQSLAEPDTVLVSGTTARIVRGRFELEDRGSHSLKGLGQPMQVWRVVRETPIPDRLDAVAPSRLTPLIGREREHRILVDRWEQARSGKGQVVQISGESGIGKSRLIYALRESIGDAEHRWLVCRCYPDTQSSALFPVIQLIQQEIGFQSGDEPSERVEMLRRSLGADGQATTDTQAILSSLLSLPLPDSESFSGQSADLKRRRTMEALIGWLLALARGKPTVVVAEDLHWADPSSLEVLQQVLTSIDDAPILILMTHRPEITIPLAVRSNVREFKLKRLTRGDVVRIVEVLAGGRRLPGEVVDQIVARTDGVPLFVEELSKMVLESELLVERDGAFTLSGSLPPLAIPSTLQDSLMARLDRLAASKETAQLAAVVGREFTCGALCAVSGIDESTMRQALDRLVNAGLIVPSSASAYAFKHALVQEVAYQSLLKSRRQLLHRQVADVLAKHVPDVVRTQPELLAHHYTAAGLGEQALQYWIQAGDRAAGRSEFREAIIHLRRGLEVLETMPVNVENMRYEVQLQVMLGDALIAVMGYGANPVGVAYGRARELCQQLGEDAQLGFVLGGVWIYYLIRAEYGPALELAQQLMRLSEKMPIPLLIAGAHTALGCTLMNLGDLESARMHLERAAEYGERDQLVLASDMRVSALCLLANVLAVLGEVDKAIWQADAAIARAQDLGKPFFVANALTQSAWIHQLAGDIASAERRANAAVALSVEQGFPYWQTFCLMTQGWVLTERGEVAAGLEQMLHSRTVAHESGTERGAAACLATLAEGYVRAGRFDDAIATLDRAQAHVDRTGERFCEAELYRLRGEILLRCGGSAERAEQCFRNALELARRQHAGLWARRAEASLARFAQPQHAQV